MRGANSENMNATESMGAGIGTFSKVLEGAHAEGAYTAQCIDADGNVRWEEPLFFNLVTEAGRNDALDKYLSGSSYTAAWYIGLMSSTGYGAGPNNLDTAASHAGWAEDQSYTQATRPTAGFASASGGSKSLASAAVFSINQNATIKGCFLISNSTKGGNTGILYSVGPFSMGDKVVQAGDTLNVSYTASL